MSTLTFVYEDRTAVLGPLSRVSEPHAYDLCAHHAGRLTAPVGWELLRITGSPEASDDLVALADAVRPVPPAHPAPAEQAPRRDVSRTGRHLYVVRSSDD